MKKLFLLLSLCLSLTLVGCGSKMSENNLAADDTLETETKEIGEIKVDSSFATLYGAYADGFDTYMNILVELYNDEATSDLYTKGKDVYDKTIVDFSTFGNEDSKEAVECLEKYRTIVNDLAKIFIDAKEKSLLSSEQAAQIDSLINESKDAHEMWKIYYFAFVY